ncbi:MAG: translesion error-prone DNA polymerase V autoproteolytic subunit [Bacteroidales bacterium]
MSIQIKLNNISTENITEGIPALDSAIPAGFPSPAEGLPSDAIDLNRELIEHPSSTFCARVTGDSMIDSGISDGDLLIIDKSLDVRNGSIAVCFIDGDFTLKRITIKADGLYLEPSNPRYSAIKVTEDSNFNVWGIVTYVIKSIAK